MNGKASRVPGPVENLSVKVSALYHEVLNDPVEQAVIKAFFTVETVKLSWCFLLASSGWRRPYSVSSFHPENIFRVNGDRVFSQFFFSFVIDGFELHCVCPGCFIPVDGDSASDVPSRRQISTGSPAFEIGCRPTGASTRFSPSTLNFATGRAQETATLVSRQTSILPVFSS